MIGIPPEEMLRISIGGYLVPEQMEFSIDSPLRRFFVKLGLLKPRVVTLPTVETYYRLAMGEELKDIIREKA